MSLEKIIDYYGLQWVAYVLDVIHGNSVRNDCRLQLRESSTSFAVHMTWQSLYVFVST